MPCAECGSINMPKGYQTRFCGPPCKAAWNSRRQLMGALFYDLVMANRFERDTARGLKLTSAVNRLASVCRERDRQDRGGRRSWRDPAEVLRDNPWLATGEGRV